MLNLESHGCEIIRDHVTWRDVTYSLRVLCQKQVSRAGTSNYIPQIARSVITCPYPWYLLLAQHYLERMIWSWWNIVQQNVSMHGIDTFCYTTFHYDHIIRFDKSVLLIYHCSSFAQWGSNCWDIRHFDVVFFNESATLLWVVIHNLWYKQILTPTTWVFILNPLSHVIIMEL